MHRVTSTKSYHNPTLFVLSLLTLALNQVVYAQESEAVQVGDAATELEMVQIRATSDTGYSVKNSSSATKTDTPIKQIPQSIQVIPRQLMDDQQNVTIGESLKNVSGVVTNHEFSTPSFEATKARGFKAEQLLDGLTQYYNSGDRESLVNVQSIEVLKGSNAVLYSGGSGSPVGGVVNITSKLPQAKAFGELGVKLGTDSFVQPFFDINQPLNDQILLRITGEYTNADSNTDVVEQTRYNLNPSILFTNNSTTSLVLQGKISRWHQQDYQGLPAVGTVAGNFNIKRDLFIGDKDLPDSKTEFDGIWATLDHKLNDVWSFNTKARYATSEFDQKSQALGGNSPDRAELSSTSFSIFNTQLFQEQTEKTLMANITANFDWGSTKNTVLLGADYSKLKDKGFIDFDSAFDGDTLRVLAGGLVFDPNIVDCASLFNLTFGFSQCAASVVDLKTPSFSPYNKPGAGVNNTYSSNTTYGVYAQWQTHIQERLHLLASLRQARVEIDYAGPELDSAATFNNVLLGNFVSVYKQGKANTEKNKILPRIGGVFDVTDSLSVFANYSEGLRGQPFALFTGAPKPEETRQKEAGIKFDNGDITGQAAFYHINRENVAVTDPASASFRSLTEGEQRSRGFDTDVTWHIAPSFSLLANYAYTNAEFTKTVTGAKSGNQLPGVAKNAARIWANYNFMQDSLKGLSMGIGATWQSGMFVDNANRFKTDSYHTIDASVAYKTERYNLGLTVKNLTNQDYYQYYNYLGGRVAPDTGTSAYLSASFKY